MLLWKKCSFTWLDLFYKFGENIRVNFFFSSSTATIAFLRTWVKPAIIDTCASEAYSPSLCTGSPPSFALIIQILLVLWLPNTLHLCKFCCMLLTWWSHQYLYSDPSQDTGSRRAENAGGTGNVTELCLFLYLRVKESPGTIDMDWTIQKEESGAWTCQATQTLAEL